MSISHSRQWWRFAIAGTIAFCMSLIVVGNWWGHLGLFDQSGWPRLLVTLYMLVAIILAYHYPISIQVHTKIQMSTVPLFLLAVLYTPTQAAMLAGIGVMASEVAVSRKRKNKPVDIVVQGVRSACITLFGALVAHLGSSTGNVSTINMFGSGIIMFVADFTTFGIQMRLLFGDHPWTVIKAGIRDMGLAEGAQYLIGILGALAFAQERWSLLLLLLPTAVLYFTCKYMKEMREDTRRLLEGMADTVDLRDPYTGGHSRRVAEYSTQILKALGLHWPEVDLIVTAARVHDIGKIGIPDYVLNKPGKLTAEERAIMETHAERGAELLSRYADFSKGVAIVRHHHESWDETGYPHQLKGTDIPFGARVIATSHRRR